MDIRKDRRLLVLFNVLGLLMMVAAGWLFLRAAAAFRAPGDLSGFLNGSIDSLAGLVVYVVSVIALTAFNVILHEAVHGIFFWLFTRSRPVFALRLTYAYAAAPGWYLPKGAFLVTTMAPLVAISLAGLLVLRVAPAPWLLPAWFVMTINAGGAVGDLAVAVWLLRQPPASLVQDRGDKVTLYRPPQARLGPMLN